MDIKVVVLDLDGTVLHNDKTISEYTLSILEKCKNRGMSVIVATARSERAAERYINKICPDIVISNGGSLVKSGVKIIYECKLSAIITDSIINELMSLTSFISITVETGSGFFVTWDKAYSDDYSHAIHYDFTIPLNEDSYKITVELSDTIGVEKIAAKYSNCNMIPFANENFYRFAHINANKINAIKEAIKFLDVNLLNVVAFGDDFNDCEMIHGCGIGVAMENGINDIKEIADYICESNDNDGVAKWIENYIL